jgi:hypothetical protein
MLAGIEVMSEMDRLHTPACPDLRPTYQAYQAANASRR